MKLLEHRFCPDANTKEGFTTESESRCWWLLSTICLSSKGPDFNVMQSVMILEVKKFHNQIAAALESCYSRMFKFTNVNKGRLALDTYCNGTENRGGVEYLP